MSKSRVRQRKAQRQKERQRQRMTVLAGGVVIVAVLLFVAFVIANQPPPAPVQAATLTRYADLEQSFTDDGLPQLGSPDALFDWYGQFGSGAFNERRFVSAAEALGLDVDAFTTCLSAAETRQRVDSAYRLWTALLNQFDQVTGTPTLMFNGLPADFGSGGVGIDYIRQRIAEARG